VVITEDSKVGAQSVTITDREGRVTWNYKCDLAVPHAWRMRSGDVLLSTCKQIRRVDSTGNTTWTLDGLQNAIKVREY
jgi:hypothetical protein